MTKTPFLALALAGLTIVGCAEEEADTPDAIVVEETDVVTEPADDMMMTDSTMMEDPMMADSTMMEEGTMEDDGAM